MGRMRQRRNEAPRDLVFTLGARLEALQLLLDAIFDALVVAGLEVQAVKIAARAPIAAVQGFATDEKYGHGDRFGTYSRDLQHQFIRHGAGDTLEKIEDQIGVATVPA